MRSPICFHLAVQTGLCLPFCRGNWFTCAAISVRHRNIPLNWCCGPPGFVLLITPHYVCQETLTRPRGRAHQGSSDPRLLGAPGKPLGLRRWPGARAWGRWPSGGEPADRRGAIGVRSVCGEGGGEGVAETDAETPTAVPSSRPADAFGGFLLARRWAAWSPDPTGAAGEKWPEPGTSGSLARAVQQIEDGRRWRCFGRDRSPSRGWGLGEGPGQRSRPLRADVVLVGGCLVWPSVSACQAHRVRSAEPPASLRPGCALEPRPAAPGLSNRRNCSEMRRPPWLRGPSSASGMCANADFAGVT